MMTSPSAGVNFVNPPGLSQPPGYSHIVEVRSGRLIVIAGQAALDEHGNLVGVGDFEVQAEQVFENLAIALNAVGCTPAHVIKLTVYLREMSRLPLYRKARDRFLAATTPPAAPAITLVEVSSLFLEEALIEIEAMAVAP